MNYSFSLEEFHIEHSSFENCGKDHIKIFLEKKKSSIHQKRKSCKKNNLYLLLSYFSCRKKISSSPHLLLWYKTATHVHLV